MQYEITETTENFDPEILIPIWQDSLPDLDERRIHWGYSQIPQGRAHLWYLSDADSRRPFGACVVLPRHFYRHGRRIRGGITADFAIKKQYRSLGPALGLQKAIASSDEFDTLLAFPNDNSVAVQKRAGFEDLGHLTVYRKIFRSRDLLKRRYNPVLSSIVAPFFDIAIRLKSILHGRRARGDYSVVDSLDERFDEFWGRVRARFGFIGERSTDYLRWRFTNHPYKSYRFFALQERDSSRVVAYLAYYTRDNIAYIDDFLFEDPEVALGALIDAFGRHCRKAGLAAMSVIMFESERYARLLRSQGFLAEATDQKVLWSSGDAEPVEKTDVFLTMGDCDI
jgi:hypothetical protein